MKNYLINEIVSLKERKKLLEAVEDGEHHIDVFTNNELRDALELKEKNLLKQEINRVNILLDEDERKLRKTHRRIH